MPTADTLRREINKVLGREVVIFGSDSSLKVEYISTGLLPIDILWSGGLARGRMFEVMGNYSTLKSYIGLCAIAAAQQRGELAVLIDTEHAFDPDWAKSIGVDVDTLFLWPNPNDDEPHTGEEAIDVAEFFIRNRVDLIVFDSVAAILPQQEANKRLHKESVQPARTAQLMSLGLRKMTAANSRTAVLWINQLREQIGVTFGNPEKATGGRALPYYASVRTNIRQAGRVTRPQKRFTGDKYTDTQLLVAQTFRAVNEKSKLDKPGREVFFDFRLEDPVGVDATKFLFSMGVELGVVKQERQSWSMTTTGSEMHVIKIRGKEAFVNHLRGDPNLSEMLETVMRRELGLPSQHGDLGRLKKKAGASRKSLSSAKANVRTPALEAAPSRSTVATKKKSLR